MHQTLAKHSTDNISFIFKDTLYICMNILILQIKNLPAVQETQEMWVRPLGREDPLEKEMATCSSILARETPWTEEPDKLQAIKSYDSN